jgi:hypothetical protein
MNSSGHIPVPIVVGLLICLLLYWQLPARPVRNAASTAGPAALAALGVAGIAYAFATAVNSRPVTVSLVLWLLVSLAVSAAFAAARTRTVRVWRASEGDEDVLRKGTGLTAALWVASVVAHLFMGLWIDPAAGAGSIGDVSLYPYLAFGLAAQAVLIRRRAATL